MLKISSILPTLFMCFSLILVQSIYAATNPKEKQSSLQKKLALEKLEKEREKLKEEPIQNQLVSVEKSPKPEGQSSQNGQPKFEPYAYP